jgi:glycosyltransferase involved in cell wall biosynthesis
VPKEDPEALFSSLALLADDPELRMRLGSSLKKTIAQEFTLEQMVHDTLDIYVRSR